MQGPISHKGKGLTNDCIISFASSTVTDPRFPVEERHGPEQKGDGIFLLTTATKDPMLASNIKKQFIY